MHEDLIRELGLAGRVAVITGAASGIARETAQVYAQAGAHVVLADLNQEGLAETADLVNAVGGQATTHRLDVSSREAVEALADEVMRTLGRLDIWVNAAGILHKAAILDVAEQDLDRVMSINMKGVYFGCAAAGRVMKAQGRGAIVNVASVGGDTSPPTVSAYAMSKSAVNALTRGAAKEFGSFGVRVNSVAPGWILTPMVQGRFVTPDGEEMDPAQRDAVLEGFRKTSPIGVIGMPRDIAHALLYLASDASRFVTGQVLRVNGGSTMPL